MSATLLTESQRRHLQVRFGSLLAEAAELRDWAGGLPTTEHPWTTELTVHLEHLARSLHSAAARLDLDIDRRDPSPERRVAAWASIWWGAILDCRPESLRGYGLVGADLKRELGPVVDELAATLVRVRSLAGREPRERSGEGE